ncbi:MAG: hypothetical protein OES79_07250 [Planctomycetota bacterium]|nr:hypothetical protein [Planctomycetota bacterium]
MSDYKFRNGRPAANYAGERRQWGRYPTDQTEVLLTVNDQTRTGKVGDESIGGVGVQLADASGLTTEQLVDLVYRDVPVKGYIKCIRPMTDGKFKVGIGWPDWRLPEDFGKKKRTKSAQFLAHSGIHVVCQKVQLNDDGSACVQLWDGTSFQLRQDQLMTQSPEQRKCQLKTRRQFLNVLNGLYGLGQQTDEQELIEAILDFEFREAPAAVLD